MAEEKRIGGTGRCPTVGQEDGGTEGREMGNGGLELAALIRPPFFLIRFAVADDL